MRNLDSYFDSARRQASPVDANAARSIIGQAPQLQQRKRRMFAKAAYTVKNPAKHQCFFSLRMLLALCLIVSGFCWACQSHDRNEDITSPDNQFSRNWRWSKSSVLSSFGHVPMSNNDMDWFGWFHNESMKYGIYYLEDYTVLNHTTASYIVSDFLVDYDENDTLTPVDVALLGSSIDSTYAAFVAWTTGKTTQECINSISNNEVVRSRLGHLFVSLDTCESGTSFLGECSNLVDVANADSAISDYHRSALKPVASIAYHSYRLWSHYDQHGWLQRSADKKDIVKMDVMGAAWGALVGGIGGAVVGAVGGTAVGAVLTGGPGAATGAALGAAQGFFKGAIGGAVMTALGASVYEGVIKPDMEQSRKPKQGSSGGRPR
jgi:hypothetical protein